MYTFCSSSSYSYNYSLVIVVGVHAAVQKFKIF